MRAKNCRPMTINTENKKKTTKCITFKPPNFDPHKTPGLMLLLKIATNFVELKLRKLRPSHGLDFSIFGLGKNYKPLKIKNLQKMRLVARYLAD